MISFVRQDYKPETLREWIEYSILGGSLVCFIFFGPFIIQYAGKLSGHELSLPVCVILFALVSLFTMILMLWRYTK